VNKKVLWSGRFKKGASESTLLFTSSLTVDSRMAYHDILGSLAHVRMLGQQGILSIEDKEAIVEGLRSILFDLENGGIGFSETTEDIHSALEMELTERVGEAGGRLHTARSRNDQVATDLRLYLRDRLLDTVENLVHLQEVMVDLAEEHVTTVMPGFTHLQHAQPVTLGYHLMAHYQRIRRDTQRLIDMYGRVNVCPLGSAALAGTTYPIDRNLTAISLGFDSPTANAMDAVSDRDMVAEYCFCASLCMMHLSSICEELVVWSSPEFSFVEMDEEFSTGSSIMPQKKNPDVAELIRGKSAGVLGDLNSIMVMMKGLPFAYNRDLQEDKEPLFRTADTLNGCLEIMAPMIQTLTFKGENMLVAAKNGFLNATELADYLVGKGMPFREAHGVVGQAVQNAFERNIGIEDLPLDELRSYSSLIDEDVFDILGIEKAIERRESVGGTSPSSVRSQIEEALVSLNDQGDFASMKREDIAKAFEKLQG
jgi:argininosuccinate lyase